MSRPTLTEHILLSQAAAPHATGELSRILARLSLAGRMISNRILNAGFLGEHGDTGEVNVQGEDVKMLDILSNDIFIRVFDTLPSVAGIASEEMEEIHLYDDWEMGKYFVLFDPLDGSGNIDIDGSLGSIFAVHERPEADGPITEKDFLQAGKNQVAAGYILYGPATVFVYTAGQGAVSGFTLDRSVGEFFLTHPNMMIPDGAGDYSVNESNQSMWEPKVVDLVANYRLGETGLGKRGARYTGALVADFHRTLLKGGIFMYPGRTDRPRGKLRYLYEASPLSMIAVRAGGLATDGERNILDLVPEALHERCPLYLGARSDVEYVLNHLKS
jgi:fructose-1,6-bisphosphatase I